NINYENSHLTIFSECERNSYSLLNNRITVYPLDNISEHFTRLSDVLTSEFVSVLNPHDYYSSEYVKDLILATKYTDAAIIGKSSFYEYKQDDLEINNIGEEHQYVDELSIESSIINISIFRNFEIKESLMYLSEELDITELKYLGFKTYSNDKMNYIKNGYKLSSEYKSKVSI